MKLTVTFDPATQVVGLDFDQSQIKTWEFVLALLEMGKLRATTMRQITQLADIQKAQAQAQQDQRIIQTLNGR